MADVLTGVRARLMINGKKIGYATGVSVRESISYEPIKVLDSIEVIEHVPVDYDVSMTFDHVRIVGNSLKVQGLLPKHGKDAAEFLSNILTHGELTADLEDSITSQIVGHVEGVKFSTQNMQINARGVVGQNAEAVAKRFRDEADLVGV